MKKLKIFLLLLFVFSINTFGQIGINTDEPNANTGLHVSERMDPASTNPDEIKGVIIQRYTTAERDNLTLTAADTGLTIFNKDEQCYNYWDGSLQRWKSLCGKLEPATLDAFDCDDDLEVNGEYKKGTALTAAEYMEITVDVTEIGSYDFKASSTPENGYQFSATGEFLSTGEQTVIMYGTGAPVNAQDDTFKLTLNGTEVCPNVEIMVTAPIKPLSEVKLGDIRHNSTYSFTTPQFIAFMNSWSNFGPLPESKVQTDGSSLAPDVLSGSESDLATLLQYDILAIQYRGGIDISAAQRTSLRQFANSPGKTLILGPEGTGSNYIGLLNDLIGDITLVSGDFTSIGNVGTSISNEAQYVTSDPANDPFLKGIFGDVTGTYFADHASLAPSLSKTKLDTSSNIQYLALRGNNVSAFKIKNKNVIWVEDGAMFYSDGFGASSNGPACFTSTSGNTGAVPVVCSPTSLYGQSSGGSIFAANIIHWALQQIQ